MKWIKFEDQKPPLETDVLIWVPELDRCDIGQWNGRSESITNGWETNYDLSMYEEITHWAYLPEPPVM